ncbi:MAG: hypothetical protein LBP85_06135 [Prevotellaceae bacterium]|jgi:hypothetical protein|nr:hypothetical protein [Prevotellaceae bacterium]
MVNKRIFKTVIIAIATMFIVNGMCAQLASTAKIGREAFEILKNMSNTNRQQFYNKFSNAISVIGSANAPVDFYNKMYDLITGSKIAFSNIKFIEFNECPSDRMQKEDKLLTCGASTLVFEYQENKYYIKVAYFLYNSKYYLLCFRDRGIKEYPF